MKRYESSLAKIPGVTVDEMGNIRIDGIGWNSRKYFEFAAALPAKHLRDTRLSELLEWLRWGHDGDDFSGVLWECSLRELANLIARWEEANPGATKQEYGIAGKKDIVHWGALWRKNAIPAHTYSARRCNSCRTIYKDPAIECPECQTDWIHSGRATVGPRGEGSYNLALQGHNGVSVAIAAWHSRGKARPITHLLDNHAMRAA